MPAVDETNIDWNEVVKKEARVINDADFWEVQLSIGYTVITEKGVIDKKKILAAKKPCG